MTYEESLRWLYALQPRGIRLELDRMHAALALRGDPHRGLRVVHVAGTNGKGSVCAMLEGVLRASGLRTGLYTSPHLHSFRERIRVDGRSVSKDEVARRASSIRTTVDAPDAPQLTFFEVTTLIALETFRDAACDVVVLEVGLGGRLDATNVIDAPLATAITSIALDHQQYLGSTIAEIAREKAGIAKPGVPLVLGPVDEDARHAIEAHASNVGAPIVPATRDLSQEPPLPGAFQRANLAVVLTLVDVLRARGLHIDDHAVREGLRTAHWPGRLETLDGSPSVIVDAAHNPHGCRALAAHLASLPRTGPRVLVLGAMADKPWREMLDILRPQVDHIIAVAPDMPRAERPEVIAQHAHTQSAPTIASGVDRARARAGQSGLVIVAGSIFVLAEARAHVLGIENEPAIPM
ncbi:bifunctional folylpolyglutamate synthase/dihydrofolate synthase [Sandaracinus amylolyticus]|uniref:bifunctional folylpolyglutamate synthase/dihydrofolate synthase n=1 Tax=Sandaracinus amylolyticus TaxID=927083 RepID=UPI001F1A0611|nr:folylpolyglutamate synthase/dihydrofolate synthase family protein [Sandaracinus amylolyticus]UJR81197.1 Bifunctional folylpolyglutamate synthase and dihydrofolate synthase [Sandaracinus amylolyticus]